MIDNSTFIIEKPLNTAVLLLIFNRLDTTKQVFEAIKQAKPPRLYIAADGARKTKEGEEQKVKLVRDYIISNIDWKCEVKTLFQEQNLGCKMAVSGAIEWFFKNEEMGIVLEDDCLPSQSFFWFCEQLLIKYKNDMRVWHIGGTSTLSNDILLNDDSYYFSYFNHIWGWAGWSNKWKYYDINVSLFNEFKKNNFIENITKNNLIQSFWLNNFNSVHKKRIDTWDYQWYFTIWSNGGRAIIPTINLVSNLGFGPEATHTSNSDDKLSAMTKNEINLNLLHPKILMPNVIYDKYNSNFLFDINYINFCKNWIKLKIKEIINIW
jgi:GR25 family glycosyltransferase involved in LPS biosynthesis